MIAFTWRRKADVQKRLAKSRITVRGHTIGCNVEATRWLGMYLNTVLQFWKHKNMSLQKAKRA